MKRLTVFTWILFICAPLCIAQPDDPQVLEVTELTVKDFPDTYIVLKSIEKKEIPIMDRDNSKLSWDDVKERLKVPGGKIYFKYDDVNMVVFSNTYHGKKVSFYIPAEQFEKGIARYVFSLKYDDFKKVTGKEYTFDVDF